MQVDVGAERGQEEAGQAADEEQPEEAVDVEHRRFEAERPAMQRGRPVEDLHGGGNRHREAQEREHHRGIHGDAGDEHVVRPHDEAEDGDGERREGHEAVAEDALAREGRDDLADDAQGRQDHDVDRRVRVEPEQVLEEHRVAAALRVEDAEAEGAFREHHHDGDGDDRRAEHLDEAGGVVRPHEERQLEPVQTGRPHAVDGDDEVQARQNRREARDEDAERRGHDVRAGRGRAVGRVERPARVDAAGDDGEQREQAADDVDVPAEQVDARERQVFRADHRRNEEVTEHRRHRRDQEEEHHDHAVQREELVVGVGLEQIALRRRELQADAHGEQAAEEEERRDRDQIEDRDPLVVLREQPRLEAVAVRQVVVRWVDGRFHGLPSRALRRRGWRAG